MNHMDSIRQLRKNRGVTQALMAEILETTQQQYCKYELRTNELPIRHLITICRHFHVKSDDLLGLNESDSARA